MTQEYFLKNAKWVGAGERSAKTFTVLRGQFFVEKAEKVSLHVLGLGFFKCYINGCCINPDTFLPLSSDYEDSCDPEDEKLSGHRIYVPRFDITAFVQTGINHIAIHYGGGWYTHSSRVFGLPKAIYRISVETENGICDYVSDENCRVRSGYVEEYKFTSLEKQNYVDWDSCFDGDYDDSDWDFATLTESLDTEYCSTDCPWDTLIEELPVKAVGRGNSGIVYDCGENTVGYPVLEINGKKGEEVCVTFSEALLPDGNIDPRHSHRQQYIVVSDGTLRTVQPEFTWYGFRCFEVSGTAKPKCVKVVHADISQASSFDCDNETLNWTYKTFLHTMLCNMHTGHPSDCPHLERRGYTGDGQLTCHAVLSTLEAKSFYEKWLQDIADCQDTVSGHIQYTAPYIRSGGGPGGWGCAIVEVPYQLYRHFGNKEVLVKYYENMRSYIGYLEAHSEYGLVTSDKEGEWCLGDWCAPIILYPDKDDTPYDQQFIIPAPMVNTYFMVKSLKQLCEIAEIIEKKSDIPEYEQKIRFRENAIRAAYFNPLDGNFIMNAQGANAFAADLGLGNPKTYPNMVNYYKRTGCFDTGIFATDILTRLLFENGDAELAVDLLTNNGKQGYEHWRQNGATTFHEYWDSNRSRSLSHPMFGSPVAYFFEYLLGIKQEKNTAGYTSLIIEPVAVSKFGRMSGSMETPNGTVAVSYKKEDRVVKFKIVIPKNTKAIFRYENCEYTLAEGDNHFELK